MKKQWDQHCPECGSDDRELVVVKPAALKRKCKECGHAWWEDRDPEPPKPTRYINIKDLR